MTIARPYTAALPALCVACGFCLQAAADTVRVGFSGTITQVQLFEGVHPGGFVGSPFSGHFSYDTDLTDVEPDPDWGIYPAPSPFGSNTVAIDVAGFPRVETLPGDGDAGWNSWELDVQNNLLPGRDTLSVDAFKEYPRGALPGEVDVVELEVILADTDGMVFSGDAIPAALVFGAFENRGVRINAFRDAGSGNLALQYWLVGTIDEIADESVPAPSGLVPVLAAALLTGAMVRRTRGRAHPR